MANKYVNDFSTSVVTYYKELAKYEPISKDEEIELIKKAKNGDNDAKNKILESNLRFVFNIANKFKGRGVPLMDLISEGNLGMMAAIQKFNPEKNNKFITYAVWWIKEYMKNSINENKKYQVYEYVSYEDAPENEKISDAEPKIDESQEEEINSDHNKEIIGQLLNKLSDRERFVVENYYGLNGKAEMNLEEIGNKMGLTKERIRKIKWSALQKMRSEILIIEGADLIFN
jgi:RNA polymerase primary sigma factor